VPAIRQILEIVIRRAEHMVARRRYLLVSRQAGVEVNANCSAADGASRCPDPAQ
jgi:hypothetical protein